MFETLTDSNQCPIGYTDTQDGHISILTSPSVMTNTVATQDSAPISSKSDVAASLSHSDSSEGTSKATATGDNGASGSNVGGSAGNQGPSNTSSHTPLMYTGAANTRANAIGGLLGAAGVMLALV